MRNREPEPTEHDLELAETAIGIDRARAKAKKLNAPRLSRRELRRMLARKVQAAGVRSAAGLAHLTNRSKTHA